MHKKFSYLWTLLRANLRTHTHEKKRLFVLSFFMLTQGALFFVLWGIFFSAVKEVNGWRFEDVARMFGIMASSVGTTLFLFNGIRSLSYHILDGSLDMLLIRPRSALPLLLMSSSSPASLGDILFGPIVWTLFGNVSWHDVPALLLVTGLSAVLFLSVTIIIFSIAFWLKGNPRFPEQMFEILIISSSAVIHGQPFGVKLIAFSLVPAGFISYLPTQLVRDFDPLILATLVGAALFYAFLAFWVFKKGLTRYISAKP